MLKLVKHCIFITFVHLHEYNVDGIPLSRTFQTATIGLEIVIVKRLTMMIFINGERVRWVLTLYLHVYCQH